MSVTVREYDNEDYSLIVDMTLAFYQEKDATSSIFSGVKTREQAEIFFRNVLLQYRFSGVFLVAVAEDGSLVGFHFWVPCGIPGLEVDYTTLQGGTYVVPTFRKQGIASVLRNEATKLAVQAGYKYVIATIDRTNTAAKSLIKNVNTEWEPVATIYKSEIHPNIDG